MAIIADLAGNGTRDRKLASPNRASVGSPYGVMYPQYSGELVLDAANGQLFVGGDPMLTTSWTPVMAGGYSNNQSSTVPLYSSAGFSSRSQYFLSTVSQWFDDAGVLQEAPINDPRELDGGVLWEPQVTNQITNPRAEGGGAVAPTTWVTSAVDATVTATWEGMFTHIDGAVYQRVRFVGTPTGALLGRVHFGGTSAIAATAANGIAASVRVMLTAGSTANTVFRFRMPNGVVSSVIFTPTGTTQTLTNRFTFAADIAQGLQCQFDGTAGMPVDFTLAFAVPTAVNGDFFTSPALPPIGSPVSYTRGATKSYAALGTLYNPVQGSVVFTGKMYQQSSLIQGILELDNATFDNRLYLYLFPSTNTVQVTCFQAGVQQFSTSVGTITIGSLFRIAMAFTGTEARVSVNGGAAVTVPGTIPVSAFTRIYIGDLGVGNLPMNGIIRSAVYYETAMPNDLLQQATV